MFRASDLQPRGHGFPTFHFPLGKLFADVPVLPGSIIRYWTDQCCATEKVTVGLMELASCLIFARAFVEYICGCVLFQDVTVREICGR